MHFKKALSLPLIAVKKFFAMNIGKQVSYSVMFGIALGLFMRFVDIGIKPTQFKVLGDVFLDLVKMTIVPLIFASISAAILSMEDMQKLGKAAFQGVKLFIFTTAVGVLIGIIASIAVKPGIGANIDLKSITNTDPNLQKLLHNAGHKITLGDKILQIIPDNLFQAMYRADLMQIIFFTVIFAVAVGMLRAKIHKSVVEFIQDLAQVMYGMVKVVMRFAPFGMFGLVVWIVGGQDVSVILALLKLFACVVLGIFLLVFVFYPSLLLLRFGINPLPFLAKMIPAQMFALATGSSAATLPLNIKNAQEKIGISAASSNLLMPIGTSVNMNGSACSLTIYTIFVAQLFGIPLGINDYCTISFLCLISAMGSPPVPGGAVIILAGILTSLGYPLEILSLILAVDKMIGPLRTMGNVTGDAFAPLYVDLLNDTLNEDLYYAKNSS